MLIFSKGHVDNLNIKTKLFLDTLFYNPKLLLNHLSSPQKSLKFFSFNAFISIIKKKNKIKNKNKKN